MQADVPVGSGGSTCSPSHDVHSFSYCSYGLTLQRRMETNKAAAMHSESRRFAAYLNIALNNRSRGGWGGWRGQEARER